MQWLIGTRAGQAKVTPCAAQYVVATAKDRRDDGRHRAARCGRGTAARCRDAVRAAGAGGGAGGAAAGLHVHRPRRRHANAAGSWAGAATRWAGGLQPPVVTTPTSESFGAFQAASTPTVSAAGPPVEGPHAASESLLNFTSVGPQPAAAPPSLMDNLMAGFAQGPTSPVTAPQTGGFGFIDDAPKADKPKVHNYAFHPRCLASRCGALSARLPAAVSPSPHSAQPARSIGPLLSGLRYNSACPIPYLRGWVAVNPLHPGHSRAILLSCTLWCVPVVDFASAD